MSQEEELIQIGDRPNLSVLEGGNQLEVGDSDTAFNSELYFSNKIFRSLLDELNELSSQQKLKADIASQNLYRRGLRLLGLGLKLAQSNLFIRSNALNRVPTAAVYKFIEELATYFNDSSKFETADFITYLLTNEVTSEIVTNLMVRPGRERSAAALAIHFGLIEHAEAEEILESFELEADSLPQIIKSAAHDIDEINGDLQYPGDLRSLLNL